MINAKGLSDKAMARQLADEAKSILDKNHPEADMLLAKVEQGISF
jgi:hypothetical protein